MLLGANGAVGRTLGPMLSARGLPYRVTGRSLLALQIRFHEDPLCEHMVWDMEDKDAFLRACTGGAVAVYLVGGALWKYKEHLPLIERALAGAREAGIERFLLISSNWSYGRPQTTPVSEGHPREPHTVKGRIRREQEDRVLAAHVAGSFATGVLRMADLYGPKIEASHLWSVFQAAKKGTEAQLLGPVDRPHEFLYVPDAAAATLRLLETEAAWNGATAQAWNLAGSGVTSIGAMAELIFATEKKKPKTNIPGKLMLRFVRSMNPYIRELQEMQYLLDQGLLLDDSHLGALLGGLERTPYEEGIRYTLSLR